MGYELDMEDYAANDAQQLLHSKKLEEKIWHHIVLETTGR